MRCRGARRRRISAPRFRVTSMAASNAAQDLGVHALGEERTRDANPHARQIASRLVERTRKCRRRRRRRRRVARVVAGDGVHRQRCILHRRRKGADLVERRGEGNQAVSRDAPIRRFEADDAAECGGLADGATGIGPESERNHPRRHRGGRSAARSAGRAVERPRIPRRTVRRILGRGTHRELVAVRLADNHRAGRFELFDDAGVVGRQVAVEHPRSGRRGNAARADVVLDGDRHTEQREIGTVGPGVECRGAGERALGSHCAEGIDLRVGRGNPVERGAADVDRRSSAGQHGCAGRSNREGLVHQPITRGTLKRPAATSPSGAAASASSLGSDGRTASARIAPTLPGGCDVGSTSVVSTFWI